MKERRGMDRRESHGGEHFLWVERRRRVERHARRTGRVAAAGEERERGERSEMRRTG